MRIRSLMFLAPTLFISLGLLSADEPPKTPPSQTVGNVYGKTVTAADIGHSAPIDVSIKFDARDTARWELMGRIMSTFGGSTVNRFVKEQKIEATIAEIAKFKSTSRKMNERNVRVWEAQLAELKKKLAATDLSDEERAKLEQERAMYEKILDAMRDSDATKLPDEPARSFIIAWKTERELHRVYGGRVIFQQAGPEALDGRRRLFEQAEKDGDIRFDDPGVRHLFYYYSNMRHTAIDEKALERPWFLDDGN